MFGPDASRVLEVYQPGRSKAENIDTFARIGTDYVFACPTHKLAESASVFGGKVWVYQLNKPGPFSGSGACGKDACHASDVPLYWQTLPMSKTQQLLSDRILTYLINFAATGNPNQDEPGLHRKQVQGGLVYWPEYLEHHGMHPMRLEFGDELEITWYDQDNRCVLWNDELGYRY